MEFGLSLGRREGGGEPFLSWGDWEGGWGALHGIPQNKVGLGYFKDKERGYFLDSCLGGVLALLG